MAEASDGSFNPEAIVANRSLLQAVCFGRYHDISRKESGARFATNHQQLVEWLNDAFRKLISADVAYVRVWVVIEDDCH